MNCNVCDSKIDVPEVFCSFCGELQKFYNDDLISKICKKYLDIQCIIEELENFSCTDRQITQIVYRKLEVYREMFYFLKSLLEDFDSRYKQDDIYKIGLLSANNIINKIRRCDLNQNKICDHCMDC